MQQSSQGVQVDDDYSNDSILDQNNSPSQTNEATTSNYGNVVELISETHPTFKKKSKATGHGINLKGRLSKSKKHNKICKKSSNVADFFDESELGLERWVVEESEGAEELFTYTG